MAAYPVIDLGGYLSTNGDAAACEQIATLLREFGMLIVKDPRVDDRLNTEFLDMMEQYYDQETAVREKDSRPDVHYQVGVTPEHIERARNHCARIKGLNDTEKPLTEVRTHMHTHTHTRRPARACAVAAAVGNSSNRRGIADSDCGFVFSVSSCPPDSFVCLFLSFSI